MLVLCTLVMLIRFLSRHERNQRRERAKNVLDFDFCSRGAQRRNIMLLHDTPWFFLVLSVASALSCNMATLQLTLVLVNVRLMYACCVANLRVLSNHVSSVHMLTSAHSCG